jgi:streptogramin lyase
VNGSNLPTVAEVTLSGSPRGLASVTPSGNVIIYRLPRELAAAQAMASTTTATWFEVGGYAGYPAMLGRLSPAGKYEFYRLPRGWTSGSAMATARDGTVWLADNTGQIARWATTH